MFAEGLLTWGVVICSLVPLPFLILLRLGWGCDTYLLGRWFRACVLISTPSEPLISFLYCTVQYQSVLYSTILYCSCSIFRSKGGNDWHIVYGSCLFELVCVHYSDIRYICHTIILSPSDHVLHGVAVCCVLLCMGSTICVLPYSVLCHIIILPHVVFACVVPCLDYLI